MSALADALVAAQRRALAATQKAYVAGVIERDAASDELSGYGLTDDVDKGYLFAALDVIRARGATIPAETNGAAPKPPEPATEAQWSLIRRLADERTMTAPEPPLTKAQAHEVIDAIKAGTYDPQKWAVPF